MPLPRHKIQLTAVNKHFGDKHVLNGVDLCVSRGESLVIIGASGSGKSVLLKVIVGLLPIESGAVFIDGVGVHALDIAARHQKSISIGMLFQYAALFDSLPVWENVTFGWRHGRRSGKRKLPRRERFAMAAASLREVGLSADAVAELYPSELSGGMKKRVGLARALALSPDILFFDEPTTGLDPIMGRVIDDLIVESVKSRAATAVTITHDLASARRIADSCAMLHGGKIVWHGAVEELDVTDNPYVRQFRQGDIHGPIKFPVKRP